MVGGPSYRKRGVSLQKKTRLPDSCSATPQESTRFVDVQMLAFLYSRKRACNLAYTLGFGPKYKAVSNRVRLAYLTDSEWRHVNSMSWHILVQPHFHEGCCFGAYTLRALLFTSVSTQVSTFPTPRATPTTHESGNTTKLHRRNHQRH